MGTDSAFLSLMFSTLTLCFKVFPQRALPPGSCHGRCQPAWRCLGDAHSGSETLADCLTLCLLFPLPTASSATVTSWPVQAPGSAACGVPSLCSWQEPGVVSGQSQGPFSTPSMYSSRQTRRHKQPRSIRGSKPREVTEPPGAS